MKIFWMCWQCRQYFSITCLWWQDFLNLDWIVFFFMCWYQTFVIITIKTRKMGKLDHELVTRWRSSLSISFSYLYSICPLQYGIKLLIESLNFFDSRLSRSSFEGCVLCLVSFLSQSFSNYRFCKFTDLWFYFLIFFVFLLK